MPCAFKPCPLEINSNGGLKRQHLESSSSATERIISPLPQRIWPPNLAGRDLPWGAPNHKVTQRSDHVVLQSQETSENRYKIYYQSAYDHQTWQDGNLSSRAPNHKVTWPFDHVVLLDHATSWNYYISTAAVPMTTKVGRMVTYHLHYDSAYGH